MENEWEYDYSQLYKEETYNPNPSGYAAVPAYQKLEPTPKKRGIGRTLLSFVLVALIGFGSGYLGSLTAQQDATPQVVYQQAQSTATDEDTDANGLVGVIDAISPSVVAITTEQMVTNSFWGGQQVESGAGSGVIFTADGYIITNNHVVSGAQQITVQLADQSKHTARLIGTDAQSDIAVIKIEASGLCSAVFGDSDKAKVGMSVLAIGNPLGTLGGTVTTGIVSGLNRDITVEGTQMNLLQTSAAVSPGNSGGGLFTTNGDLIGIVNAKSGGDNVEGLGFAIPVNTAKQVALDLINNGFVGGRPALGVMVVTVADAQTAMQYGVNSFGVYIQSVDAGGGAEAAGIKVGDRVVSIGNVLVETTNDLTNELQKHKAGDTVTLQIDRNHELLAFEVVLGEKTN